MPWITSGMNGVSYHLTTGGASSPPRGVAPVGLTLALRVNQPGRQMALPRQRPSTSLSTGPLTIAGLVMKEPNGGSRLALYERSRVEAIGRLLYRICIPAENLMTPQTFCAKLR
jgi:hypothetical protein